MFTLEQITEAHSHVKSGADFPAYVQALIALGVRRYDSFVADGHAEYLGTDGSTVASEPIYPALAIAERGDAAELSFALAAHQAGGTDYLTFCREAAAAGVEKWRVDTEAMTCTYLDRSGTLLVEEVIPKA